MGIETSKWKKEATPENEMAVIYEGMPPVLQAEVDALFEKANAEARRAKEEERKAKAADILSEAFREDAAAKGNVRVSAPAREDLSREELDLHFANAVRAVSRREHREPLDNERIAA